ncbi:cellulose biosynthesis cyclic di-GMP-binding regulatory protein BcsB [Fulvimarina pelagi]|nr:cellulose biosynthesis cyclic di-GMP-binding regulatory protein BcsB [Fulvimarina pelagi]
MAPCTASAQSEGANPFISTAEAFDGTTEASVERRTSETLRLFPAGKEDLFLSGERASRNIAYYVTAAETALPARLVLELETAVSVMPELSSMNINVNDQPVASTKLGTGTDSRIVVDLPAGLLQPGFNAIELVANHRHRVDCSIPATYELWTQIDSGRSGIDFGSRSVNVEQLSDFPALARTGQQLTPINLVLPHNASNDLLEEGMQAAQAVAILAQFENPSIRILHERDSNSGLNIVIGETPMPANAQVNILAPGISLYSSATGSDVIVGAGSGGKISSALDTLTTAALEMVPIGSDEGLEALRGSARRSALTDRSTKLADLGLDTAEFSGRHYQSGFQVVLPPDFYAADYAAARLTINAAYAAGLSSDAELVVRANGKQVTSLSLSSTSAGELDEQHLDINLGMLKPGLNVIAFEAFLPRNDDEACEPATLGDQATRFVLRPSSKIDLPAVARIGHLPELAMLSDATMMSVTDDGDQPRVDVLTGERTVAELEAVGSILTNMAITAGVVFQADLIADLPEEQEGALIAVGTLDGLPSQLLSHVGLVTDDSSISGAESKNAEVGLASIATFDFRNASFAASFSEPIDLAARLGEAGRLFNEKVQRVLGGFASLPGLSRIIEPEGFVAVRNLSRPADEALVVAQAATPTGRPYPWTVFAAENVDLLTSGIQEVTKPNNWSRVAGAAGSISKSGRLDLYSTDMERLYETQPRSYENLRLVFAGWLSRHLYEYLAILLVLALALGVSTRFLLKNLGAKA